MKKTTILFIAILMSAFCYAQQFGSGTITVNTIDGQPHSVTIYGSHLVINPNAWTSVSGVTNEPIDFGPWLVNNNLNTEEFKENLISIYQNPCSCFKARLNGDINKVSARIYDISGRLVTIPSVYQDNEEIMVEDDLNGLSDGIYIVQINSGDKKESIKIIKDGRINCKSAFNNSNRLSSKSSSSKMLGNDNYRLYILSNDVIDIVNYVEILPNDSNNIILNGELDWVSPESGDVAIRPWLNGTLKYDTNITLTNTSVLDSIYSQSNIFELAYFWNIYVSNSNNPTSYRVDITSNEADPDFLPTTAYFDIYQDLQFEINGFKQVNLTPIPNEQDITMVVRDFETLNPLEGVTVEVYSDDGDNDFTNDVLMDSQVSDVNGEVFFDNVAGGTDIYFKNSKTGYYTKTNNGYSTPVVDRISEMDTLLNVLAVPKFNYWDDTPVEASRLNLYHPLAWQTEFALGHWRVYFPPANQRQTVVDHFADVAAYLGFPNAVIAYDTPFMDPRTNENYPSLYLYNTYQPYIENREVHEGLIGTNISSYSGTGTDIGEKVLENGIIIAFYTLENSFNLGGLDWSKTDHEIGNALGFPLISSTATYPTSRDLLAGNSVAIVDSMSDSAIMPFWLRYAKLHFDMVDAQGRLIEFMPMPGFSLED